MVEWWSYSGGREWLRQWSSSADKAAGEVGEGFEGEAEAGGGGGGQAAVDDAAFVGLLDEVEVVVGAEGEGFLDEEVGRGEVEVEGRSGADRAACIVRS